MAAVQGSQMAPHASESYAEHVQFESLGYFGGPPLPETVVATPALDAAWFALTALDMLALRPLSDRQSGSWMQVLDRIDRDARAMYYDSQEARSLVEMLREPTQWYTLIDVLVAIAGDGMAASAR